MTYVGSEEGQAASAGVRRFGSDLGRGQAEILVSIDQITVAG